MRLGTKIAIVGIVVFLAGAGQPAVYEETEFRCEPGYYGECGDVTTYEPNESRGALMGLGGFLFSAGIGGWIGTYDAEGRRRRRRRRELEDRASQADSSDD